MLPRGFDWHAGRSWPAQVEAPSSPAALGPFFPPSEIPRAPSGVAAQVGGQDTHVPVCFSLPLPQHFPTQHTPLVSPLGTVRTCARAAKGYRGAQLLLCGCTSPALLFLCFYGSLGAAPLLPPPALGRGCMGLPPAAFVRVPSEWLSEPVCVFGALPLPLAPSVTLACVGVGGRAGGRTGGLQGGRAGCGAGGRFTRHAAWDAAAGSGEGHLMPSTGFCHAGGRREQGVEMRPKAGTLLLLPNPPCTYISFNCVLPRSWKTAKRQRGASLSDQALPDTQGSTSLGSPTAAQQHHSNSCTEGALMGRLQP